MLSSWTRKYEEIDERAFFVRSSFVFDLRTVFSFIATVSETRAWVINVFTGSNRNSRAQSLRSCTKCAPTNDLFKTSVIVFDIRNYRQTENTISFSTPFELRPR